MLLPPVSKLCTQTLLIDSQAPARGEVEKNPIFKRWLSAGVDLIAQTVPMSVGAEASK